MNGKNSIHIWKTHQNRVKIWIRSFQNHRNSLKTEKISEKTSTKFQSTISNASKRCQNVKNTKNSKRYISNSPKASYFSKNHVLEPRKIAQIVNFHEKSKKLHCKNQKDTWTTRQNRVKIRIRSTKIVENRQTV